MKPNTQKSVSPSFCPSFKRKSWAAFLENQPGGSGHSLSRVDGSVVGYPHLRGAFKSDSTADDAYWDRRILIATQFSTPLRRW